MEESDSYGWMKDICRRYEGTSPAALLEAIMDAPECPPFGPAHHLAVGAALITCVRIVRDERSLLDSDLSELQARAAAVPGAACARWSVCGAAISAGMAFAILNQSAPLKEKGWSQGQAIVADIAAAIARSGRARCCKRDSRIAARVAAKALAEAFDARLDTDETPAVCETSEKNTVCSGDACPFFPKGSSARLR